METSERPARVTAINPRKQAMSNEPRISAIEANKARSRSLRGMIAEELATGEPCFSPRTAQLLKFHGIVQYADRDQRRHRRARGLQPLFRFTLRVRPTGGRLTPGQLLGVLELAQSHSLDSPRITSRQGLQLSGATKGQLKTIVRQLAELGLSTFASGGDVNCNVMCCPDPHCVDPLKWQLHWIADQIATSFMPDDGAYREIWLADETHGGKDARSRPIPIDPIYGPSYLPHKFKIGLAFPEDNCIDVLAQDVGLLAVVEGERIIGFDMWLGGGLGMIPSVARSVPMLARPFAFVPLEQLLPTIFAVLSVYRDFGNRSRRSGARLKYLLEAWGLDAFRRRVESRLSAKLAAPRGVHVCGRHDHLGWHRAPEGIWSLGLAVENGRIGGPNHPQLPAALKEILAHNCGEVRLTPSQDLLIAGIAESSRASIQGILDRHAIAVGESLTPLRRGARACPALPSCRSAITEAERIVPQLIADLEKELARLGLADEPCSICVAGCPCGCTRSYLADIAIVGRTVDTRQSIEKFAIFVGGDRLGRRLNRLYRDLVPRQDIIPTLRPLLTHYRRARHDGETLGEFLYRVHGDESSPMRVDSSHEPTGHAHSSMKENQV